MATTNPPQKYVLSGGPGNGKSTLCEKLHEYGEAFIEETPRMIIDNEECKEAMRRHYKGVFPWTNLPEFERLVLAEQSYLESRPGRVAKRNGRIWLDRSLIDIVAYCELGKIPIPEGLDEAIESAGYTKVYMLDPLTFYKKDNARHEERDEALKVHEKLKEVYRRYSRRLGFDIQYVPDIGLEARGKLLMEDMKGKKEPEFHSCMQYYDPKAVARLSVVPATSQ